MNSGNCLPLKQPVMPCRINIQELDMMCFFLKRENRGMRGTGCAFGGVKEITPGGESSPAGKSLRLKR